MATTPQNARDIAALGQVVEGLKRKILMQDIKINGLLKRLELEGPEPVPSATAINIPEPIIEPPADDATDADGQPNPPEAGLYDSMDVEELKAIANERGLKYHPASGYKKLRSLLEDNDLLTTTDDNTEEGDSDAGATKAF